MVEHRAFGRAGRAAGPDDRNGVVGPAVRNLAGPLARVLAAQIVEILRGANPGDIPYSQAVRFDLSVNLKTAKELGIEMPAGLVAGATTVIE